MTRRIASYRILRLLLQSQFLAPHLKTLLSDVTNEGLTPFMLAVKCKAYLVATFLFEVIQKLVSEAVAAGSEATPQDLRRSFLFPPMANPDDSPLFMLCYNDTCSFTWTGPNHIRQDIFECRTCGLMDSLCCCTECARVCHKGHDCRLKQTSPTAYCDCWEKCRCRSLIAGAQAVRRVLFSRLLYETDLVFFPNGRSEHLLLFLTKSVERQCREQKHYRPSRRRLSTMATSVSMTPSTGSATGQARGGVHAESTGLRGNSDEPEHDMEPP